MSPALPHSITSVGFLAWLVVVGVCLLVLALVSRPVRRLPLSPSTIYLALGFTLGPQVLGWLHLQLDPVKLWFERLAEVAVVVALFISGLKLRLPLGHQAWAAVFRLAGPVMLLSILGVALLGYALGLSPPHALLLGAVLAPTDPVLASAVSVNDASDKDRLRYGLSGEAGLNDGMAFPFVVLALHWLGQPDLVPWLPHWALRYIVWAVPAGLGLGYLLGMWLGRLAIHIRTRQQDTEAPSDFVAMAIIALSYAGAELIGAWGFLAVFAAGLGLRHAELAVVAETPHPRLGAQSPAHSHPPAEELNVARVEEQDLAEPAVAAGVLVAETITFGGTAERMLEVVLVTIVGGALGTYWDPRALLIALVLFCVVRPLAVRLSLWGTPTTLAQRWLMGWFGIRGIGSLYYLAYALNHGLVGDASVEVARLTISLVAISILVHGISATPLLNHYVQRADHKAR